MVIQDKTEEQVGPVDGAYEPPRLTKFGTIEEWTRGMPGGIAISIIL